MWGADTDAVLRRRLLRLTGTDPNQARSTRMPLYMDIHTIDGGVAINDVADAHAADLKTQGGYDVRYLRYWVNEPAGKIFCLVEAPSVDAADAVHRQAHGLVADELFEVKEG